MAEGKEEIKSLLMKVKNKCKKAKWLSEEASQIAVKRREVQSKGVTSSFQFAWDFSGFRAIRLMLQETPGFRAHWDSWSS